MIFAIPIDLNINCPERFYHCYISAALSDCTSIEPEWEKVFTEPTLPVETGTELKFVCPEGYDQGGSRIGMCIDGQIQTTDNVDPVCLEKG